VDNAPIDLSYCIVNTNGGELLERCLDAIERFTPDGISYETLVLDNASDDGSPSFARGRDHTRLTQLTRRTGKAENDSTLLEQARGEFALLLNEDSEITEGSVQALIDALKADPDAAAAGAQLLNGEGVAQPCAWRFTTIATSLAEVLWLHRQYNVQSKGEVTRRVDWAQSAGLLLRRERSNAIGNLDPDFFVYSDEVDLCKRLSDAGGHTLYVPGARIYHREGLVHGGSAKRRIVELHRGRDRYMTKHHGRAQAAIVRVLVCVTYLERALASVIVRRHEPRRFLWHARAAIDPSWGEGLRESAARWNSQHGGG
jgi:GT2 family glycosyltransferase